MVASGLSSKVIARKLSLSPQSVRVHRLNIYAALGVHSVAELILHLGTAPQDHTPTE